MGQKPLDPVLKAEALRLVDQFGTVAEAARATGIPDATLRSRYHAATRDPAIEAAMGAVGTGLTPALAWLKTKSESGHSYSVLLKPTQEDAPDRLEAIRTAFEGMTPAPAIAEPHQVMGDLCTLYPLMDVHLGMQAWGKETGAPDYDIDLACQDMRHAFAKVLALTPPSAESILVIGGDFFHANDNLGETQASRHKLDMDGRHRKVLGAGVAILKETINRLLTKHAKLTVRVMRGNHDPESHLILTFALLEHYRENRRVTVENIERDLFMFQWGECSIFAHHGDKFKPQAAALYISDACPFWSSTRHRHFFTGHVHHDQAKDLGPLRWESLRAFCPPDAYAASMGYGARRALQSVTFHKVDGLVLRALDPIDRPATAFRRSA